MGYRSDIVAVFYAPEEDFPLLKLWMEENAFGVLAEHQFDPPKEFRAEKLRGYEYSFEDVKWYDAYEDVQAFERVRTLFCTLANDPETVAQFAYEFIRVGEEAEDIEKVEAGDVTGVLWTSTSIQKIY